MWDCLNSVKINSRGSGEKFIPTEKQHLDLYGALFEKISTVGYV